jgi:transposase
MIRLDFTEEQRELLRRERFQHPHPRVQMKMEALLLKSEGLAHGAICKLVGISANTLRGYFRDFERGGVEALKRFDAGGSVCELDEYTDQICDYLVANPPHTIAEAGAAIAKLTGIHRGETQIREFLQKIGLKRLKVGSWPAKAEPEEQERFKKTNSSLV